MFAKHKSIEYKYLRMVKRSVKVLWRRWGKGKERPDIQGERKHIVCSRGGEEGSLVAKSP